MLATVMSGAGQWRTAAVYGNSLSGPLTRTVLHIIESRVLYIYSAITLSACLGGDGGVGVCQLGVRSVNWSVC